MDVASRHQRGGAKENAQGALKAQPILRDLLADQFVSSTSVSGRSLPAAVSVCQWPFSSSYSMVSVCPGMRCSAAAVRAAASAAAWVGNGSENTPLTVYAQPSSWRTM